MPYNGSGVFNPLTPPNFPAVAGTPIEAARFNANLTDLHGGLSVALPRDGQAAMTGLLNMGGFRITNVANAASPQDVVTKSQLDSHLPVNLVPVALTVSGSANAWTATTSGFTSPPPVGQRFTLFVPATNTGPVTFTLNTHSAQNVHTVDGPAVAGNFLAGAPLEIAWNGANYIATSRNVPPPITTGFKNCIFNGAMRLNQRDAGVVTGNAGRPVDQWVTSDTFGTQRLQASQETFIHSPGMPGFTHQIRLRTNAVALSAGAAEQASFHYPIEGVNCSHFRGQTYTVSFYVRSNITGNFCVRLHNPAASMSYVHMYTIHQADTWERKSFTVVGGNPLSQSWETGSGFGMQLAFALIAGGSFQTPTANAWVAGNIHSLSGQPLANVFASTANALLITGVQIELGSVATDYEFVSIETEISRAQRYFYRNYGLEFIYLTSAPNQDMVHSISFPVQMRTTPANTLITFASASNITFVSGAANSPSSARIHVRSIVTGIVAAIINNLQYSAELA